MTFLLEDPWIYHSRSQKSTLSLNSMIRTGGRQETKKGKKMTVSFNLPAQNENTKTIPGKVSRYNETCDCSGAGVKVFSYVQGTDRPGRLSTVFSTPEVSEESRIYCEFRVKS